MQVRQNRPTSKLPHFYYCLLDFLKAVAKIVLFIDIHKFMHKKVSFFLE